MYVLLMRLEGPLQSWGTSSKFSYRDSEAHPTKSGVIGLIASALGKEREEPLEELTGLRIGVREDKPGRRMTDFQTSPKSYLSSRVYLEDAEFLVGIESESLELLRKIETALTFPAHPLYLGRKACPANYPIALEIIKGDIEKILGSYPIRKGKSGKIEKELRIFIERGKKEISSNRLIEDEPVSFSPKKRVYGKRRVFQKIVKVKDEDAIFEEESFDVMEGLKNVVDKDTT